MKDLWNKFKRPTGGMLVLTYVLTVAFIAAAIFMLTLDYESSGLSILAYSSFALSAIALAYSTYTVVIYARGLRARVITVLSSREFTRRLLENWGYRTVMTSTVAFTMTLINSAFNAYLGISERSVWFGALAAYYVFLALMRSGLLLYHRNKKDYGSEGLIRAKKYTRCGILLLILNAALSSAIAQMIFDDRAFEYKDWLIYAFAAYAFYKIIMSAINVMKARRQDDLTIRAIREINLVDAAVSILALQTALLHTFDDGSSDISLFNTVTGCFVSIFALTLSIFMILKGTKTIKELKGKMHNDNNKFNFTYSAPTESERREIESIRRQYIKSEKQKTPEEEIRRLHAKVVNGANVVALIFGVFGTLTFGLGLTFILEWNNVPVGVLISVVGALIALAAYPAYRIALKHGKEKYGETIIALSEKVLGIEK